MKLHQVEIFDFRSIKQEKIEFNRDVLCFVGKNECGKTSIIEAIKYLNIIDYELSNNLINKNSRYYPDGFPLIVGVFNFEKSDIQPFQKLITTYMIDEIRDQLKSDIENFKIQLTRWGNGFNHIELVITDGQNLAIKLSQALKNEKQRNEFLDKLLSEIFPKIEFFSEEELLLEPATVKDLLSSDRKFETFRRLLAIGDCKDLNILNRDDPNFINTYLSNIDLKLNKIFKSHYTQDSSIKISIRPGIKVWGCYY